MEQEHLFILDLIENGKITVPEALELIEAVDESEPDVHSLDGVDQTITVQLYLN
jgi:hypothetical protein